ncbi:MAG: response regulator transcription factor [Chloroflexi bacterium]|nr:response regulator transcription factor [Chloroflexota bacterium]
MAPAAEKIRVLIVDDTADTRDNLTKLLGFESDIEVVGTAASGQEAITLAKQERPHAILMDINMPDLDGITATEIIANTVPESPVIMMSIQGEQDYFRRSMLAGAREFLVKPFSADELVNAIRHVYEVEKVKRARYAARRRQPALRRRGGDPQHEPQGQDDRRSRRLVRDRRRRRARDGPRRALVRGQSAARSADAGDGRADHRREHEARP